VASSGDEVVLNNCVAVGIVATYPLYTRQL